MYTNEPNMADDAGLDGNDGNEEGVDPPPRDDAAGAIEGRDDGEGKADVTAGNGAAAPRNDDEGEGDPSRSSGAGRPAPSGGRAAGRAVARRRGDREMRPAPYFYYVDRSRDEDEDSLSPLSPALSAPNFVIKLHAILIRDSLSDVIGWMPHGRSWKIFDQPEFEKRVLPVYFQQSSISSFHRQANGWGFRRMLKGADKGSFYHERFLRGLPFLCKKMKRTGVAKVTEDDNISHEPMLWLIDARHSTPRSLPEDSLEYSELATVNKIVQEGGPKAKMPFVHNIDTVDRSKRRASEEYRPGNEEAATTESSKPRASSVASSGRSVSAGAHSSSLGEMLPVQGGSRPYDQASFQRQQMQLAHGQLAEPYVTGQQVQTEQPHGQIQQAAGLILQANATEQQVQTQSQQAISMILQASNIANTLSLPGQIPPAPTPVASLQRNQAQQHQSPPRNFSAQNIAEILSSAGIFQPAATAAPVAPSLQENLVQQHLAQQQPRAATLQIDTTSSLPGNPVQQHLAQQQPHAAIPQINATSSLQGSVQQHRAQQQPHAISSLQGPSQQHRAQQQHHTAMPQINAASLLKGDPAQEHRAQQQPHATMPQISATSSFQDTVQQHLAQQQPHAALPQINAISSLQGHVQQHLVQQQPHAALSQINATSSLQGPVQHHFAQQQPHATPQISAISSLQGNLVQQHRAQQEDHATMPQSNAISSVQDPVQQHCAQQQSHAAIPQISAIANILRSSGQFQSISNPAAPADIPPSLQGSLSDANTACLLGSTGNSARFLRGAVGAIGGDTLVRSNLWRADQTRSPHSGQGSDAALRYPLLQNLAQNQSLPVLLSTANDARFLQGACETSGDNVLGPPDLRQANEAQGPDSALQSEATMRDLLQQIFTQNQPQAQNQPQPLLWSAGNSARFPRGAAETNSGDILGQLNLQQENQLQGPQSAQLSETILRNLLLQNLSQNQPQPASSLDLFGGSYPSQVELGQIQSSQSNLQTSSAGSLLSYLRMQHLQQQQQQQQQRPPQQHHQRAQEDSQEQRSRQQDP